MTAQDFNSLTLSEKKEALRFGNTKYGFYWKSESQVCFDDWSHRAVSIRLSPDYQHLTCSFEKSETSVQGTIIFERDSKKSKWHTPNTFKQVLSTYKIKQSRRR
ncbi:hypothetical protein LS74_001500 [Helicobacter magdeburgensis]|uniref:Uncharacterized protein n=1 Tax=Helicobacter magdeburgensis TaxID=471858 RepID=A0A4U8T1Z3_9HELI|nr:hypothetical protein [Helicobacter magdeburgensis]TLD93431.1 hypothetical protein LS74_001500 [Helicobacter magdeburgensis]